MSFPSDRKCQFCAEVIKCLALICRYCNRAVSQEKRCTYCCEPIRQEASRCRFCLFDQVPQKDDKHPPVTGISPTMPTFGFQAPVHEPIVPKKLPEQCQAEDEFQQWRQRRLDAIAYGEDSDE